MNTDLVLVLGLLVSCFSAPAFLSAISDGRAPRSATIAFVIGAIMIVIAISQKPGGYKVDDIPKAFIRVIASIT